MRPAALAGVRAISCTSNTSPRLAVQELPFASPLDGGGTEENPWKTLQDERLVITCSYG